MENINVPEAVVSFAVISAIALKAAFLSKTAKEENAKISKLKSLPKWHETPAQDVFTNRTALMNDSNVDSTEGPFDGNKKHIVVIGAGTVGLSMALRIKEELGNLVNVTIMSETFLQQTTSYNCGGLWEPYQIAGTPDRLVNQWGEFSFQHYRQLYTSPDAAEAGVQLMTNYVFQEDRSSFELPSWKDIAMECREIEQRDLPKFNLPAKYTCGYSFGTFVVDQKYYMAYLTRKLMALGVRFVQKKVLSLEMFENGLYDGVVNCTGLGASTLCCDLEMYPIRGQVMRVKAPWMKCVWFFGSSYIIPNVDTVVLGGTAQRGSWDTNNSVEDCKKILDDICEVFPALRNAPVENVWAGLRPGRTPVRLSSETKLLDDVFVDEAGNTISEDCNKNNNNSSNTGTSTSATSSYSKNRKPLHIMHCYGHGGSGITLAMGCAEDIVQNHLIPRMFPHLK